MVKVARQVMANLQRTKGFSKNWSPDGDITVPERAEALASATGVVAHAASIGRYLRKLGSTYKISHWSRPKLAHG